MPAASPTFRQALRFWFKLGLISFGGPSGQIAIMHTELVEKNKWVDEEHFLHALNYCMLLPGPEATQLATYCGWLLHRTRGGLAAGVLFVLPSALLLWLLSYLYLLYGQLAWLNAAFNGLKPAVTAIVLAAVWRVGRRALKNSFLWVVAATTFAALFFFHVPFPAVMAGAALAGWFGRNILTGAPKTELFNITNTPSPSTGFAAVRPSLLRAAKTLAIALALWWTPVIATGLWLGWQSTQTQQGFFFSKAALVTFGGAYAVLPYVGQQAVEHYRWLSTSQMLDGLGLAETTPGPLIMVLQFVGFLGGWQNPVPLSPPASATLSAALTTWTTFVPSFLFIFLGAPYIERLRRVTWLNRVLSAVTAAVVGVILNLALWFGLHVFFPSPGAFDWFAIVVAALSFAALQSGKTSIVAVVLAGALMGVVRHAAVL